MVKFGAMNKTVSQPNRAHHETNRLSWNEATKAHNSHKGDQARFFREGGSTLFADETALLGDLDGKTLLHLQCNSGQDSLSIAKHLGADVTGVDISDEAVRFARRLSRDSGIPAAFVRADIYDFFDETDRKFDCVFASYGALVWLSELSAWGRGIARCLKPGGRFVFIDFHPAFGMLDEDWRLTCDYMGGSCLEYESGIGDYVALTGEAAEIDELEPGIVDFVNPHAGYEYLWGIADVVMALVKAGLRLTDLREYSHCNGFKPIASMRDLGGRRYAMPLDAPQNFPFMFSIVAERQA